MEHLVVIIVALALGVGIFLALREFFCWYWKINEIVGLLEDIRDRLPEPPEEEEEAAA